MRQYETHVLWYDELTRQQRAQVREIWGEGYESQYMYIVEGGQVKRRRRKAQKR